MNNEVAIAAGALAAALLDSLVAKEIFTKEEAAQVVTNAISRTTGLKITSGAATSILAGIAGQIAARS